MQKQVSKVKKVLALVVAMLLLVAAVPMTASAAADNSLTLSSTTQGFVYTVYELATFDHEGDGSFTPAVGLNAILATVITDNSSTKVIVDTADDVLNPAELGTVIGTYNTTTDGVSKTFNALVDGLYYVKATTLPADVTAVTNSALALPWFDTTDADPANHDWSSTYTINVGNKLNSAYVNKEITDSNEGDTGYTSAGLNSVGDAVDFELSANIPADDTFKLKNYVITDILSPGLTNNKDYTVKLVDALNNETTLNVTTDYVVVDNYVTSQGVTTTFGIQLTDALLQSDALYTFEEVVVTYTAVINENAVIGNPGNPNSDGLDITNQDGDDIYLEGDEVVVYTYGIEVLKTDANTGAVLAGAEFVIYAKSDIAFANPLATAVSDATGLATFKTAGGQTYKFTAGEYVVKETKAPTGYTLNNSEFAVTIDPTFAAGVLTTPVSATGIGYERITVENTMIILPQTGGMGTTIFMIIGASLILFAGVMFIVVRRKSNSK